MWGMTKRSNGINLIRQLAFDCLACADVNKKYILSLVAEIDKFQELVLSGTGKEAALILRLIVWARRNNKSPLRQVSPMTSPDSST